MSAEAVVVTVRDAASMLSISPSRIYQLIAEGTLIAHKMGRARRVSVASVHKYLADTTSAPSSITRLGSKRRKATS